MRFRPTIILIAPAGRGQADAGAWLQQPFAGSTVLGATLAQAVQTQLPVLVVTTARLAPLVAGQLALRDLLVLDDADAARGVGHFIAAGVAERSGAPGWLVQPGHMPLVRPGTILAVATALEQAAVVYPEHRGRRGHPVGFAAELYSELVKLQGAEGARRIVARYPAQGLVVDDAGVQTQIDSETSLLLARTLLAPAALTQVRGTVIAKGQPSAAGQTED